MCRAGLHCLECMQLAAAARQPLSAPSPALVPAPQQQRNTRAVQGVRRQAGQQGGSSQAGRLKRFALLLWHCSIHTQNSNKPACHRCVGRWRHYAPRQWHRSKKKQLQTQVPAHLGRRARAGRGGRARRRVRRRPMRRRPCPPERSAGAAPASATLRERGQRWHEVGIRDEQLAGWPAVQGQEPCPQPSSCNPLEGSPPPPQPSQLRFLTSVRRTVCQPEGLGDTLVLGQSLDAACGQGHRRDGKQAGPLSKRASKPAGCWRRGASPAAPQTAT